MRTNTELAELLRQVRTSTDVERILRHTSGLNSAVVPVGGRENNIGTIRMASDPGLALIERLTNGMDSVLELAVLQHPNIRPQSPQAAARLLGVPAGGLADMTDAERRSLADRLVICMHESGVRRRPTVSIQDSGMGQHPSKMAQTLLSLNENNKVGKPYTMGTYGQGGSVTFGFSPYTVIMTRRHPELLEPGQEDVVGWTVVYEEQTDPTLNIMSRYVWLVQADGSPFTLPASLFPDFDHGVRVTHVEYDVQSLQGPFTTQMWQFLHAALFEPVLPFLVTGDRDGDPKKTGGQPDSRVVIGNAARLANVANAKGDLELGAHDSFKIELGAQYGSVTADYWALVRPAGSSSSGDPAASYVDASSAVSLTLHGQRQDAERRSWIKDRARLPFLYKGIVVHINANNLLPNGRRELFASTRERATESELRRLIYARVAEELRTSDELKALNHAEKERMLQRSTAATNEKVRKRLGKFIKQKLEGVFKPTGGKQGSGTGPGSEGGGFSGGGNTRATGGSGGGGGAGRPRSPRDTDDSQLPHVPTRVSFSTSHLRVRQGTGAHVWVEINAKNGYLPTHDDDLTIDIDGDADHRLSVTTRSKLLGGKSRWALLTTADTPVGHYKLRVALMTANGELAADLPIEVVPPRQEPSQPKGGNDNETGPDVRWLTKQEWPDDFTAQTVGRVTQDDESTIIWVNRDYDLLAKLLAGTNITPEQIELRADRYQFPVACGLWLQHHDVSNLAAPPSDDYQQRELHRLAEAVLVAMDPDVDLAGSCGDE
jgi:hypothetical protein